MALKRKNDIYTNQPLITPFHIKKAQFLGNGRVRVNKTSIRWKYLQTFLLTIKHFIKKEKDKKKLQNHRKIQKNENSLLNLYNFNQFYDSWRVTCSFRGVAQFWGNQKCLRDLHFPQKGLTTLIKNLLANNFIMLVFYRSL